MLAEIINSVLVRTKNTGAQAPARACYSGELATSDAHARYQEAVLQGNVYLASNQAAVALSNLSVTATGLILTNPVGSGKNLVIWDIDIALATAPAGASTVALAANVNILAAAVIHTTPLVVRQALLGGANAAVGLADSAATLPAAPVVIQALGGGPVAAASLTTVFMHDEVAGAIILVPGTAISLTALTTAISAVSSIMWEEVPV